ncbi:Gfo/Idh/MocA family oxidoreductase [Candidatus Poribacteria bacterium]|nr:Gfo/Idh/MocA family oxidoreductase [Candidatus Poribacteria bacterium]
MKIGILGCGGIATPHADAIAHFDEARLVHVADVRKEGADVLASKYSVPRWSDDPQAVVDDAEVEWVIICLPTFLHASWIQACADAGKHVLTEKPLARTVEQAKEAIEACRAAGVRLYVNYQRRYSPGWQRPLEVIQAGKIGRPVTWNISSFGVRSDFYRGPNNWMWDFEQGGGLVMDGSIHQFDLIQWISGKPVEMFARSRRICPEVTAPTEASAYVRFGSGDHLNYAAAWQSQNFGSGGAPFTAVGEKGTLFIGGEWDFTLHTADGEERFNMKPEPGWISPFYQQLLAIYNSDTSTHPALVTGEDALASLWMSENIVGAGPHMRQYVYPKF